MKSHPSYIVFGSGRMATHIRRYFDLLEVPYLNFSRNSLNDFQKLQIESGKILLLISDDAIENFYLSHRDYFPPELTWIHFSGALSVTGMESAHPLASFTEILFDKNFYEEIFFVTESGKKSFTELFPELNNRHIAIPPEEKKKYHAWGSMAGNFTALLWLNYKNYLSQTVGIPDEAAKKYFESLGINLFESASPLTGPIARGDKKTIEMHLDQLKDSPYEDIYKSFVKLAGK